VNRPFLEADGNLRILSFAECAADRVFSRRIHEPGCSTFRYRLCFFIHAAGKRQQKFPPRSVFFWVLMVSWRATGNIVIRRSRCPVRVRVLYIIGGFFS